MTQSKNAVPNGRQPDNDEPFSVWQIDFDLTDVISLYDCAFLALDTHHIPDEFRGPIQAVMMVAERRLADVARMVSNELERKRIAGEKEKFSQKEAA